MDSSLLDSVRNGDRRALSRAITLAEQGNSPGQVGARVPVVGFTGPPGAGKSTLISALITEIRGRGETVGVLAVDPSSPLTGGALLGDRIRMQGHVDDAGVYVRSMASRGHLGGLAEAASAVLDLMGCAGFDRVVVETVGVGQSEVEVMQVADLVVLVVSPGWGDQIQADKAGIVEIADLYVVNKGDRPGVADVLRAIGDATASRGAPILVTVATTGEGVGELLSEIDGRLAV